jgi:hypothetical protein
VIRRELAESGFAGDGDDGAATGAECGKRISKFGHLDVATDDGGGEPIDASDRLGASELAGDAEGGDGFARAFDLDAAEVLEGEELVDLAVCVGVDLDGAGASERWRSV